MISTSELKNGVYIKLDGEIYQVTEFLHVKPGKGPAFVRTKIKNISTGQALDRTFKTNEKIEDVYVEKQVMQYLYKDGDKYNFMNNDSYEQIEIHSSQLGDVPKYLTDGVNVQIAMNNGAVISVELPAAVVLEVVETDPGMRGDTVSGGSKPATLETGAVVQVPLFINIGDKIKIDTRTGQYLERV